MIQSYPVIETVSFLNEIFHDSRVLRLSSLFSWRLLSHSARDGFFSFMNFGKNQLHKSTPSDFAFF